MSIELDGVWKDCNGRALVQLFCSLCIEKNNMRPVKGTLRLIKGDWSIPGFVPLDILLRSVLPKHELLIRLVDFGLDHESARGVYYTFEGITLYPTGWKTGLNFRTECESMAFVAMMRPETGRLKGCQGA